MCRTTTFVVLAWVIGLAIPASADLVGYWKMDQGEGTAVWDYAEPYEDATISPENPAAVRWTTEGYKDGALEFLISTGPFTMVDAPIAGVNISEASYAFWMNMPKAFQAWGPIFVLLGGSIDHSIECDGAADLYISSGAVWFGTKGAALNDDQWHHVAVTYSTSGNQIAIYVDGKVAATSTSTLSDAIATVRIGGPRNRNQWRRFIGKLDDAAVWGNALSAEDVKNVFWVGPQWMRYATHPTPANEAIVDTANVTLAWTQGETASQHHVYVGEVREDVQNGTGGTDKGLTSAASFSNYPWALGKTYYWRVDEVEADGKTTYPGTVWTFTISAKLASNPAPTHGAVLVDPNVTLTWVAGSGAVSHDVYFGTDPANLAQVSKAQTGTVFTPVSVAYDTTYAWRVDEFDGTQTYTGDVWTFKTTPDIQVTDPNLVGFWDFNRDEDGIALDWSGHGQHGTLFGDPNRVAGYHQGAVAFDGMDDTVEVPQVISREAVSDMTLTAWIKADVPGAQGAGARQGSGLLWSDHAGGGDHFTVAVLGTKLAFETGPGGNPNTISNRDVVTGEWVHVAVTRAGSTSDCQVFIDGALDAASVHTGDTRVGSNPKIVIGGNPLDGRYFKGIIDEVRAYNRVLSQEELAVAMRANRLLAWDPRPVNGGVVDIRDPLMLTWSAGDGAVSHDVYFGTDPQAVGAADPAATDLYRGRLGATVYTPPDTLQWAQAYAWRVDEVAGDGTIVKGPVWSLSVADYFIVDDFEAYDDACNRVFFGWLGGAPDSGSQDPNCPRPAYTGNGTGSTIGNYDPPFAEQTVVYSGRQSMPMEYDNTVGPFYSEATKEWPTPQSWTDGGVDTLSVHMQGAAPGFLETADGTITMNGTGADIWGTADQFRFAYKRLTGNGSITARVDSLTNVDGNAKAGVMIRETLDDYSMHALVDITPSAGLEFIRRVTPVGESASTVQADLTAPYWVRLTRNGQTFTAQCSADGVTWTSVGADPAASSVAIPMGSDVYVGLVVTSRSAGEVCVAVFSNCSTTGTVTGAWESVGIGEAAQSPGNLPETVYAAVQDTAGNRKVVSHPDPAVIATGNWEQWDIPLSEFSSAGVNLGSVMKLTLGVGNPAAPTAGGAGKLYIDDIRIIKVANP